MTKPDYRYIYIFYVIVAFLAALWLNSYYLLTNDNKDVVSLVANTSEILGLSIALTEIFVLSRVTERIRKSLENLQSYSDVSNVSILLTQTKDDIVSKKYGTAILRLEMVRDIYQENIPSIELENTSSIHRISYDKINSIITSLTMAESRYKIISQNELNDFVKFLTKFNETIISLKVNFKKSIL